MTLFKEPERMLAHALSALIYANPFSQARIQAERAVLGRQMVETDAIWSLQAGVVDARQNIVKLRAIAEPLLYKLHERLNDGVTFANEEEELYAELVWFVLYHRLGDSVESSILLSLGGDRSQVRQMPAYDAMVKEANTWFMVGGKPLAALADLPHIFALIFQIRRAFVCIFHFLVGGSQSAAALRSAIWESIFTFDMRRYRRSLHNRMHELATLITGPSGTGKELVAQAIGWSRFIPFDAKKKQFVEDFDQRFYPVSLASLSPTLLESEVFGHKKGSFTGAQQDRAGYLEVAGKWGTVFLDEIGETSLDVQVKLLRVLQTRTFHRLGDTEPREFSGKVIAATNRDLAQEIRKGTFRVDFYYRLCSDLIQTPSLHEQIVGQPNELENYVLHLAGAVAGEKEAAHLASEVMLWLRNELPAGYTWPGNVRELEQCVRNVMVRGSYKPEKVNTQNDSNLLNSIKMGTSSLDDVTTLYCTQTYHRLGNYEAAARHLGIDSRTLKSKIDKSLLRELAQ